MKPTTVLTLSAALLFALCGAQKAEEESAAAAAAESQEKKTVVENAWPKTSVWLVTFDGREGTRLMVEAADLLASQDFNCTLVLVGPAIKFPIKPTNALIKVVSVETKEAVAQTEVAGKEETVLLQGEIEAHLAACQALLLEANLIAQLKSQPPKVVIFPGYLHDGCILPLLSGVESAAVVLSTGSVSLAWLGHATNTVPFSALRAPLQPPSSSLLGRAMATLKWNSFTQDYEQKYWKRSSQMVANRTEKPPMKFDEAYQKVAFLASGSHALLENPVPALSLKVSIGCFHCRHANLLPEELQEWILPRKSGMIVITLDPTKELVATLSIIAREMPQYGFLWIGQSKLPETKEELPSNIVHHGQVSDQDALGHPKARLVISECSEILVLGSMFHGVPAVCVPKLWEEKLVAERAVELGIGLISSNDPMELEKVIKTITENQTKYRGAARHLGVIIRDEPETASDRLTFWVGHTARHWGHGHDSILQEARNLPRDLFGLIDVGFVVGAVVGTVLALLVALGAMFALGKGGKVSDENNKVEGGKKKGKKGE